MPYVRRYGASKYGRSIRRVGMAARVIQGAYRNRRAIKTIAKFVRKRVKPQMTKWGKRMRVVEPKQRASANQDAHAAGTALLPLGSLSFQQIQMPNPAATARDLGGRRGIYVYLKGIRICRQFEFLRPSEQIPPIPPIIMHYAVVQLKDASGDPAQWGTQFRGGFFRAFNETADKTIDFVDNTAASGWSSILNCCNMNPDNEFNILTHKRRKMEQPQVYAGNVRPGSYIWQIDKYVRVKKRIAWANINATTPIHPLIELFWFQTRTPSNYPVGNAPGVATWSTHTKYYKEIPL